MNSKYESSANLDRLAARLRNETRSEVLFDRFSRGRYATDASIYQIEPVGVVVPCTGDDLSATLEIAREEGVSLLPRGGGTSQSGQTVGNALVMDCSRHLNRLLELDEGAGTCVVEPGIVLDDLNRQIAHTGLWFPVDVSTKSRATIGGMTGNNSCGTRSIRYGVMRDNVMAIDAILPDGAKAQFGVLPKGWDGSNVPDTARELMRDLLALGQRDATHIAGTYPDTARRVGGYNLDALLPGTDPINLATLLVGSEGTLALSERITLKLSPQPGSKALGVCHFPTFRAAMEAAQHIVRLGPVAVEVVDSTLIGLARDIPMFRQTMDRVVQGQPDALLLTEFSEVDDPTNARKLGELDELMGDLGLPGSVVKITEGREQAAVWSVREAGLNIMMSMKSDGKPVSFIEDCAVPLEHLADYTERLTAVFERHGTRGTWYAHASVGCLHVRPVLNLKQEKDAATMRAIAEEAFAMVREYKGAHSGEHGDGLVRSEFHRDMYGDKTVALFEEVKDRFDPGGLMNPGKIVRPPRMDDRILFRYKPDYRVPELETVLEWPGFTGAGGGFQGAVEMCNNNGACRALAGGVMCPSYRATRNERDVTRGRANSLRLAISGQLGPEAFSSDEMLESVKLCVSCKGCRRECPTGVDMAKMKIEVLNARSKTRALSLHDRLVAHLPRYAPVAARLAPFVNLRDRLPGLAGLSEHIAGFAAQRKLPKWQGRLFRLRAPVGVEDGPPVALFADTFNTYFEPENLWDSVEVLTRLGYRVSVPQPVSGGRPLCCGRTYLAAGLVDQARKEARRLIAAIVPLLDDDVPIVGIEPSCLLTLRDELQVMGLGDDAERLGDRAQMLEEFLAGEADAGRIDTPIGKLDGKVLLHGHCHQKAFGIVGSVQTTLGLIDGLETELIESSCCGMAGAFGYGADTYDVSMQMAELSLLPSVRKADAATMLAADGFSCRHQIRDGSGRQAHHVAGILKLAMQDKEV